MKTEKGYRILKRIEAQAIMDQAKLMGAPQTEPEARAKPKSKVKPPARIEPKPAPKPLPQPEATKPEPKTSTAILVVVESPYQGTSAWPIIRWWQRWRNIQYARRCLKDCLHRGESPIASHLLYTQRGVLNDLIPFERALGIKAGLAWKTVANYTVVYADRGISRGMQFGIEASKLIGQKIETRYLWRKG